jgi:branched-chain amino acid transport system substrate-binding protein
MNKKILTLFSLLVLVSLVLAACAPAAPATTEAPPAETEAPAEDPCATDAIGCIEIPAGGEIHLAYALVVAGPNETLGIDSRNGIEVAIDDVGGEILGHPIKFDGQDTGCSAEGGQAAGTALAADPSIVAVFGTSCSSEARVAIPLFDQAGFTVVSPSNTAPDLTDPDSENSYIPTYTRTAHNDNFQGTAAAEYVFSELGFTKAATIHDGSLYADQLQQVFASKFQELGGTITAQEAVDPNQADMSAVLTSIAAGAPEMIYFPIFLPAGGLIIRQIKQTPGLENVQAMGADGLFSPDVIEAAGADVEGFRISSPAVSGSAYEEFLGRYEAKFGTGPISIFHAHAYDAFMITKNAIEKVAVQGEDGSLRIPRQALREAVHNTENYQGLTGNLTCNETVELGGRTIKWPGDCAATGMAVWEYHDGEFGIFVNPEVVWIQGE